MVKMDDKVSRVVQELVKQGKTCFNLCDYEIRGIGKKKYLKQVFEDIL